MSPPTPFSGPLRKLALAFDVGTTFSGIGYAILDPGEIPRIQGVTRFPGQENGDFKIPSILWYDQDGNVRAAGAEARDTAMRLLAEDEDLVFVEWFKLHLRPHDAPRDGLHEASLPPLPSGKTVVDIFGDFLAYLFNLWSSFEDRIEIILSHPNGWEGAQQGQMRQAAVLAGLVPDSAAGHARVHFVTEGEASLHYCIDSGLTSSFIRDGASVMIVDAGGGTVDLSTYTFTTTTPISVEEIAPADCIMQGSTRVNMRASEFLKAKLRDSKYGNDEDIKTMLEQFEKSTKPTFKDKNDRSFIRFGSMRDKDPNFGIRGGQVPLEGHELAQFFEPSVLGIVDAIAKQRLASAKAVKNAFLVGGFAASPWLFARLKSVLESQGVNISRPDNHTNKAVAEGAVSFFLGHFVSARVAKFTYGVKCVKAYDANNLEHLARRARIIARPSGNIFVPGAFQVLLGKGSRVREFEEVEQDFNIESEYPDTLDSVLCDITCYKGKKAGPQWTDIEPEYFSTLCMVHADTSKVNRSKRFGTNGYYYQQDFKVVLSCGLTEMKAQISWLENGIEKRGPAKIVYDDDAAAC